MWSKLNFSWLAVSRGQKTTSGRALAFSFDVYLFCSLQWHLLCFPFFFWHLSLTCCCLVVFSFLSSFCHLCHLVIWFFYPPLHPLNYFSVPLLSSSATLNFKILLNLCHIVMLYFFNQVLAIDHTIFVVILIIEVRTIDDLKFQMMRMFYNFFNFYQSK